MKVLLGILIGLIVGSGVVFAAAKKDILPKLRPYTNFIYEVDGRANRECWDSGTYQNGEKWESGCIIRSAAVHVFDDAGNKCYVIVSDVTDHGEIRDSSISCVRMK